MATVNYAIHLNGSNEHWTINDDASFDYATGDNFTFGLWFRRDYNDNSNGTRSYLWSRENQHAMYIESDELVYYFNGAGGADTWRTGIRVETGKAYLLCLTGVESTNTTVTLYIDGEEKTSNVFTGGMPNDTNTNLYFGIDYGTTSGYYFKGTMTGWFQSKDTAISSSDVETAWNSGIYDIDTVHGITGLDDGIGFVENTGTTYDNALNAGVDGAGQNTPTWVNCIDPMAKHDYNGSTSLAKDFTGVGQNVNMQLYIDQIRWVDAGTADDDLEIIDINGNLIWKSVADGADFVDTGIIDRWVNGLEVSACDSGEVYVYLR